MYNSNQMHLLMSIKFYVIFTLKKKKIITRHYDCVFFTHKLHTICVQKQTCTHTPIHLYMFTVHMCVCVCERERHLTVKIVMNMNIRILLGFLNASCQHKYN